MPFPARLPEKGTRPLYRAADERVAAGDVDAAVSSRRVLPLEAVGRHLADVRERVLAELPADDARGTAHASSTR